ncbi:hypothetical protein C8R45DRAFT_1174898 [Mycena sanguinolenta]|nr:hypothetical protein C8R45DRAFT_1174898 [Mycena sanguinolenta]
MTDVEISGDLFNLTHLKTLLSPDAPLTEHGRWLRKFSLLSQADRNIRVLQNGPNNARGTWVPLKYLDLCMVAIGVADDTREKTLENLTNILPPQYRSPSPCPTDASVADGDETIALPLLKIRAEENTLRRALEKLQEEHAWEEKVLQNSLQRARKEYAQEERSLQKALQKLKQDFAREEALQKAPEEEAQEYMREILQIALQELHKEYEQKVLQIQLFGAPIVEVLLHIARATILNNLLYQSLIQYL